MKRIVIAGMGNVLLSDDGLGPYVIGQLEACYDFGPEVELLDIGTPALDFALYFANADLLVLIDAVKSSAPVGTVLRYSKADILRKDAPLRMDAHSPALGHALQFAEFAGASPQAVLLVGASAGNTDPGTALTDPVRAAVPALLELIAEEVRRIGVAASLRHEPRPSHVWWETASAISTREYLF